MANFSDSKNEILSNQSELAEAILAVAGAVIVVLDRQGRIVRFNESAAKLTGFTFAELRGQPIWDYLIPPEARDAVEGVFASLVFDRLASRYENEWLTKSGGRRRFSWRNTVLHDADGQVSHVVAIGDDVTERDQMLAELKKSELLHADAQRAAGIGSYITDLNTGEWECSAVMDQLFGITKEYPHTIEGWVAFMHPDFSQAMNERLRRVIRDKLPFDAEYKMFRPSDGQERWMHGLGQITYDDAGHPVSLLGTVQDITERKLIQQQMADSQQRFQDLVEISTDWIWEFDEACRFTYVSEGVERILGYRPEELLGKTAFDLMPPEVAAEVRAAFAPIQAARESFRDLLNINLHKDGSRRELMSSGRPIFDSTGTFRGYRGADRDVTEANRIAAELADYRELLEERVREQTARLAEAQRIAGLGSWHLDLVSNAVTWSEALYAMFDYDPALPAPAYPAQAKLFTAASWETLSQALRKTADTGEPYELELQNRRRDGSHGWIWARGERLCDAVGKPIALHGIAMDISQRKEAERLMLLAREKAEAASQAKTNFLANMSHEIRTPMHTILGLTYLLQRDVEDAGQQGRLGKIADSATHLLGLINDILDLSKIEADSLQLEETELTLGDIFEHVLSIMSDRAKAKGLMLRSTLDPLLASLPLLGDPLRIRQILVNYLSNAIKFTEQGDISLRARLDAERSTQVLVHFEVEDDGIGVPAEAQGRIFEAFEQAEAGTTRKFGGTGLGLAISRRFARLMGGDVGVISEPGQGSTFWFTAVLKRGVGVAKAVPEKPASIRRGARVLLVEDIDINQEIAGVILEEAGLLVDVANHGREAVDKVQEMDFDLILMDMQMPVMDGLEATRKIRALGKVMPIISMTANAFQEDKENCLAAGMNDFVTKPIDPELLFANLAKWLPA